MLLSSIFILFLFTLALTIDLTSPAQYPAANSSSKILIIHPIFAGSHILTARSLAEALVTKGHSVHIIRWRENKESRTPLTLDLSLSQNLTQSVLTMDNSDGRYFALTKEKQAGFVFPDELIWKIGISSTDMLFSPEWKDFFPFLASHCETLLGNTRLTHQLRATGYDMVIVDLVWNECSIFYARHILQVPLVLGFWGISPETLDTETRTNFIASSHFPIWPLAIGGENSGTGWAYHLAGRVFQFGQILLAQLAMWIHFQYIGNVMQKYGPSSSAISPLQVQQDLDGVLINYDSTLDVSPRAVPPNHVTMGGIQILSKERLDSTHLPNDVLDWMNEEESAGVIFFSIGFTLGSENAPKFVIQTFLEAFGKFPQFQVLFQFGGTAYNVTIPPNVKMVGWLSQQKILAHPKTKLFVNHCGLQGVTESIYYGIPIVCMPIINDAAVTLEKIIAHGIGAGVRLHRLTTEEVTSAIQRVIFTSSYSKNVQRLSALMKDVKETPVKRTIDFLEHLLCRSKILNTHARARAHAHAQRLSFFEYFYLDIIFVSSALLLASILLLLFIIKVTFSFFSSNSPSEIKIKS